MKVKPQGKIIIIICVMLLAGGAYRMFQTTGTVPGGGSNNPTNVPGNGNSATTPVEGQDPAPTTPSNPAGQTTLTLLTSSSKEKMLKQIAESFQKNNPNITVVFKTRESRDGLQAILSGAEKPDLYSPSDAVLVDSLNDAWKKQHGGQQLINTSSPEEDITFAETPIVFLTNTHNEPTLRPILTGARPYTDMRKQSALRFSFATPLNSGSGLLSLGQMQSEGNLSASLKAMKGQILYDDAARKGSSQLVEAYINEMRTQGVSPRAFITAYESKALEVVHANPSLNLRVIYPSRVPVAAQRIVFLDTNSPNANAARAFLAFLKTPEAADVLVQNNLHPKFDRDTLATTLSEASASGFRTTTIAEHAPSVPYNDLMNSVKIWSGVIGN
jgi:ABC-type molybdate transport system substrate-binding protein